MASAYMLRRTIASGIGQSVAAFALWSARMADSRSDRYLSRPASWGYRRNKEGRQDIIGLAQIGIHA